MAVDEEERRPAARVAVVPQLIYALLRLEPVHGGGHAEHAHEGAGGLLVAGGDGAPLLESGPEALDEVPVAVDVVGAGYRRFVALGRDRGPRAQVPDMLPKGVAGVAAVAHDPLGHPGQAVEQRHGVRQFMRLARREAEGDGASFAVGDHAGLGAIATTRAPKRLMRVPPCRGLPFLAAPAAFWWARIEVPSRKVIPSEMPVS